MINPGMAQRIIQARWLSHIWRGKVTSSLKEIPEPHHEIFQSELPQGIHSLKLTAKAPENRPQRPKMKLTSRPTIHFQVLCLAGFVSGVYTYRIGSDPLRGKSAEKFGKVPCFFKAKRPYPRTRAITNPTKKKKGSSENHSKVPLGRGYVTLPETNSQFAPENKPKRPQKEMRTYSKHPFSGAFSVSFRECMLVLSGRYFWSPSDPEQRDQSLQRSPCPKTRNMALKVSSSNTTPDPSVLGEKKNQTHKRTFKERYGC